MNGQNRILGSYGDIGEDMSGFSTAGFSHTTPTIVVVAALALLLQFYKKVIHLEVYDIVDIES